jgi:MbtH protein
MSQSETNPFEDDKLAYWVLINHEKQYSLWPQFADIPAGWQCVYGLDSRSNCLKYIEENWVDMRPLSLIQGMTNHAQ